MMKQNPFPEERKMREEGRQAPEPRPERRGTSKSWWNRTLVLRKGRREKKGDKHRNPSPNQEEPANHEGTKAVSSKNWEPHSAQELFGELITNGQQDSLLFVAVFWCFLLHVHHVSSCSLIFTFFPSSLKGRRWSAAATWRRCGVRRLSATTWAQWLKRDGSLDGFSLPQHFANNIPKYIQQICISVAWFMSSNYQYSLCWFRPLPTLPWTIQNRFRFLSGAVETTRNCPSASRVPPDPTAFDGRVISSVKLGPVTSYHRTHEESSSTGDGVKFSRGIWLSYVIQ